LSGIDLGASTDVQTFYGVFIVAHEHDRCPSKQFSTARIHSQGEPLIVTKCPDGRYRCRHPFGLSSRLSCLAEPHDGGVKPQTGIINKDTAVDLCDVDRDCPARAEISDGCFQFHRNSKILAKMIQCPQRKHTEEDVRPGHRRGNCVDGAIPTAGNDQRASSLNRFLYKLADVRSVRRESEFRVGIYGFDRCRKIVARFEVFHSARLTIDNYLNKPMRLNLCHKKT
jgi:hypothetical protein